MYHTVVASETIRKLPAPSYTLSEYAIIVYWMYALSQELDMDPQVYTIDQEPSLWVYFPHSCFGCDSFLEEYGIPAALVSRTCPICVNGTVGELEPGELTSRLNRDGVSVTLQKRNISGKDFDRLTDLCVTIHMPDIDALREMQEILSHMRRRQGYVAVRRTPFSNTAFATFQEADADTHFRYLSLGEEAPGDSLAALAIEQQVVLWRLFLEDGFSAVEFDHVLEALHRRPYYPLFTWELALRLALSAADIHIACDGGGFRVTDAKGQRRRFDYAGGTAAEKLFLKILFPVPPQG